MANQYYKTNLLIDGSIQATDARIALSDSTETTAVMINSSDIFSKRQLGTAGFLSPTAATNAAMQTATTTSSRNYEVQNMADVGLMVNVPWTDTNTQNTYTKASFDLDHLFNLIGASADTAVNMGSYDLTTITDNDTLKNNLISLQQKKENFILACSDETTALTASSDPKVTFRMPYAFRLTSVRASVNTASTGANIAVDITYDDTSVFNGGAADGEFLSIDATEKTSTTAGTAFTFASGGGDAVEYIDIANDNEMVIILKTVGSTVAGAGLKVTLLGYQL